MVITSYLDTSAAMKLIVEEAESDALLRELESGSSRRLVASWLLHAELHCAAGRNRALIEAASIAAVLDAVTLIDLTRGDLLSAGALPPLRSNDAIHLATALRTGVDELITYDAELTGVAAAAGMRVTAPA